jgi:hypothetical protein
MVSGPRNVVECACMHQSNSHHVLPDLWLLLGIIKYLSCYLSAIVMRSVCDPSVSGDCINVEISSLSHLSVILLYNRGSTACQNVVTAIEAVSLTLLTQEAHYSSITVLLCVHKYGLCQKLVS